MNGNMMRVIGAPGAGKTQFLRSQVEKWTDVDGIDPEAIVLCSFTRTAAAVLRGRVPVPAENAATLHSLAYRAIGRPKIAEVGDLAKQWNEQRIPDAWKLGASKADIEEGLIEEMDRGQMLARFSLWRATLAKNKALEEDTKFFAEAWGDFKAQTDSIDFEDMIELALGSAERCPGDPECFVVDEAQDLQPMQWLLAHQWGQAAQHYMVAGDPAQVLYGWIGARPDELLEPLPPERQRLLSQSHRLPRVIQEAAEQWLSRHSGTMMQGRQYHPTSREGQITHREYCWREPYSLIEDIEERTQDGRKVMVLATCSYLLKPTVDLLRAEGVPFYNPYRPTAGAWNPLRPDANGKTTTQQRVRLFLAPEWTGSRAATWLDMLPAEWFAGTKKGAIERLQLLGEIDDREVLDLLKEQARAHVAERDVQWLAQACGSKYEKPLQLIAAIWRRYGRIPDQEPQVIVGTVHSVKGGEADSVILYPDLPRSAVESAAESTEGLDAVIRQGYVGMTRARDELVWYAPERDSQSFWGV